MSKEKRREPKTGEESKLEHVDVLIFLVMIRIDLNFFIFFSETRLSKEQFRLLNHPIRMSIKIVMIFGSWLLC